MLPPAHSLHTPLILQPCYCLQSRYSTGLRLEDYSIFCDRAANPRNDCALLACIQPKAVAVDIQVSTQTGLRRTRVTLLHSRMSAYRCCMHKNGTPETHNKILLECMAAGVVVTTISAAAIEGFTWVHPAPVIQRTDILVFLPPTNGDEYKNVPFASIAQFDRLAAIRFENDLTSDVPPAYRYIHMSNVHSLGDTRVHAFILSIPSINKPDEVIAKCYLTYAAHWLDDMFDRKINRRHLGKRIISTGGESWYDPVNQVDRKFRPIIKRVMTGITHHDYALVAIKRLMLGSLYFSP